MKKTLLALVLIPSLAFGAGWDETVTSPQPDDTIMINDVSQPDGSKTQYSSLKTLPVPDLVTTQLNTKVSLTGDETVNGIKNFTSSPIVPEPTTASQVATKNYVDNMTPGASVAWGAITGTLSDQSDLNTALLGKVNTTGSENINGVKTFLLPPIVPTPVSGTDAVNKDYVDGSTSAVVWGGIGGTITNQADLMAEFAKKAPSLTSDQNYVTDDQIVVIDAQSGTNTGDQDISNFVSLDGAETIADVKTFSSSPIVPTPTTGTQAATKDYADTKAPALTADQNYMTDAEKTKLGQQSGTNTGDQDISNFVSKTGNESVAGIKTFSSSPIVPTPTTDFQTATKEYVDNNAGGGIADGNTAGDITMWSGSEWLPEAPTLMSAVAPVVFTDGVISMQANAYQPYDANPKSDINIAYVFLNEDILGAAASGPDQASMQIKRIPYGVSYGDFVIACNGTSTTPGVVRFGVSSTYNGTYTALTTTASLNGTTEVTVDFSGEADITSGQYLGVWLSTANAGTATSCDGSLELINN